MNTKTNWISAASSILASAREANRAVTVGLYEVTYAAREKITPEMVEAARKLAGMEGEASSAKAFASQYNRAYKLAKAGVPLPAFPESLTASGVHKLVNDAYIAAGLQSKAGKPAPKAAAPKAATAKAETGRKFKVPKLADSLKAAEQKRIGEGLAALTAITDGFKGTTYASQLVPDCEALQSAMVAALKALSA